MMPTRDPGCAQPKRWAWRGDCFPAARDHRAASCAALRLLGAEGGIRPWRCAPNSFGFDGGDSNFYRYMGNEPTRSADPLGLFTYQWKPDDVAFLSTKLINGLPQIGYSQLFLDIAYSKVRRNVSFIQVNTVTTTVVTVDQDGKVDSVSTTRYYEDATDASGEKEFKDRLGGPNFSVRLRPDAVIVISQVTKKHGLVPGLLRKVPGTEIKEARAKEIDKTIEGKTCLENGSLSYAYYWSEIDKAVARKAKPADLLKQLEGKVGEQEFKSFLEDVKKQNDSFDFEKYNGQFLISSDGQGLYVQADLKGNIKK
jgi:hypothetical protein